MAPRISDSPDRDFHPMPCPVMLDVGDLGHYASFDHYSSPSQLSADSGFVVAEVPPLRFPRLIHNRKMTRPSSFLVAAFVNFSRGGLSKGPMACDPLAAGFDHAAVPALVRRNSWQAASVR